MEMESCARDQYTYIYEKIYIHTYTYIYEKRPITKTCKGLMTIRHSCNTLQHNCNTRPHTATHGRIEYPMGVCQPSAAQTCGMPYLAVCCSVMPRVAVVAVVLQCVAVCCSMLQWGVDTYDALSCQIAFGKSVTDCKAHIGVLQCVAVYCSVLQCVAVRYSMFQCVADVFLQIRD